MTDSSAPRSLGSRELANVPARIAALPSLPVFHKLAGRKVVVVGSSEAALWKAELLCAAGADVLVLAIDEVGASRFRELTSSRPAGSITVHARAWKSADLDGAALSVADVARTDARRFAAAARQAGAPVNIVDRTDLCDFQFGTIVNRSPVVISISTDGAAPMLGQSIRARIESILPLGLAAWAKAAQQWRPRVKQGLPAFADRRGFWQRFTRLAWSNIDRLPQEGDYGSLIAGTVRAPAGSVTLVGAGPGDPELLTLKAVRVMQSATVILYDDLVGPEILELARREARRISVGKSGYRPSCGQPRINEQLVQLARAGETIVRLKGGDPLIFGRATEEVEACRAAGFEVAIIPGISAAQAAAARLGISMTERKRARRVQFVTGHGADGNLPDDIDWSAVADRKTTTVIYMPRKTLAEFVAKAVSEGLDPLTPAAAIASASLPTEVRVSGRAEHIAELSNGIPAGAPVTVVIGWVARALIPDERQSSLAQARAA